MSRFPFGGGSAGNPTRRSGGGVRILIGLAIALFGIIGYLMKSETNPVTGEKQRVALSVPQEIQLGLQSAPQMAGQMGGQIDPSRDQRAALVAQVGQRLVDRSEARKSPYTENFNFYLLNDTQTINAFALPGGQIFITAALFDKFDNEAQLAGVLGHEIAHVIHRHAAEHMAKGQLGQSLVGAVAVGASDQQGAGQFAAMAAQLANNMLQLKYGRGDELESDAYGMKIMAEAGYDPSAQREVMRILNEASKGNRPPQMLSSHPHAEDRIVKIDETLKRDYPNGIPSTLSKGQSLK